MLVMNYTNKFNELAQYAPNDIPTDEVKHLKYENGLSNVMQDKICNIPCRDFNELVSIAIIAESKKLVLENDNHKRVTMSLGQGSSSRQKVMQTPPRIQGYTPPRSVWIAPRPQ